MSFLRNLLGLQARIQAIEQKKEQQAKALLGLKTKRQPNRKQQTLSKNELGATSPLSAWSTRFHPPQATSHQRARHAAQAPGARFAGRLVRRAVRAAGGATGAPGRRRGGGLRLPAPAGGSGGVGVQRRFRDGGGGGDEGGGKRGEEGERGGRGVGGWGEGGGGGGGWRNGVGVVFFEENASGLVGFMGNQANRSSLCFAFCFGGEGKRVRKIKKNTHRHSDSKVFIAKGGEVLRMPGSA